MTLEQAILWFERELPRRNARFLARREEGLPLEARWEWRGEHLDQWFFWGRCLACAREAELPRHLRHPLLIEQRLLEILCREQGCEHLIPLWEELSREAAFLEEQEPRANEDIVPWCGWPARHER